MTNKQLNEQKSIGRDFSFLAPAFWGFWEKKQANLKPFLDDKIIRERLSNVGLAFNNQYFQQAYAQVFSTLNEVQLATIADLLSHNVQSGQYEFSIKKRADFDALHWTFIHTVRLGLPKLDLWSFTGFTKSDFMPYRQCLLCGRRLKEPKRGQSASWCHFLSCNTSSNNMPDHRHGKELCCRGEFDRLTRYRLQAIRKAVTKEFAIKHFEHLLETIFISNLGNAHKLLPITPNPKYDPGFNAISTIADLRVGKIT